MIDNDRRPRELKSMMRLMLMNQVATMLAIANLSRHGDVGSMVAKELERHAAETTKAILDDTDGG